MLSNVAIFIFSWRLGLGFLESFRPHPVIEFSRIFRPRGEQSWPWPLTLDPGTRGLDGTRSPGGGGARTRLGAPGRACALTAAEPAGSEVPSRPFREPAPPPGWSRSPGLRGTTRGPDHRRGAPLPGRRGDPLLCGGGGAERRGSGRGAGGCAWVSPPRTAPPRGRPRLRGLGPGSPGGLPTPLDAGPHVQRRKPFEASLVPPSPRHAPLQTFLLNPPACCPAAAHALPPGFQIRTSRCSVKIGAPLLPLAGLPPGDVCSS